MVTLLMFQDMFPTRSGYSLCCWHEIRCNWHLVLEVRCWLYLVRCRSSSCHSVDVHVCPNKGCLEKIRSCQHFYGLHKWKHQKSFGHLIEIDFSANFVLTCNDEVFWQSILRNQDVRKKQLTNSSLTNSNETIIISTYQMTVSVAQLVLFRNFGKHLIPYYFQLTIVLRLFLVAHL